MGFGGFKDVSHHLRRELAGESVLLAGVEGGEEEGGFVELVKGAVREGGFWAGG